MIGEPCNCVRRIRVKIDDSNSEIVKTLKEETMSVRNKIDNMSNFIDNTDNKLSEVEWLHFRSRFRLMQEYYNSLMDSCRLYNIVDDNGNIIV